MTQFCYVVVTCLLTCALLSCAHNEIQSTPTGTQVSVSDKTGGQNAKQSVTPSQEDACFSGFPNLKTAWDLFTQDDKWRMARRSDFRFSQVVLAVDGGIPKFVDKPCVLGQLRGPDARTEFAAIVVSDQLPEQERYGVIVFNGVENKDVLPEAHWLMQQVDLSRSKIYTRKRRLFVGRYDDDHWVGSCGAYWDEAEKKYSCLEGAESNP